MTEPTTTAPAPEVCVKCGDNKGVDANGWCLAGRPYIANEPDSNKRTICPCRCAPDQKPRQESSCAHSDWCERWVSQGDGSRLYDAKATCSCGAAAPAPQKAETRWKCACGWYGTPSQMTVSNTWRTCPQCGASGGLIIDDAPAVAPQPAAGDEPQTTLDPCRWCNVPPELKAIRQNDPQFGDEWSIGCVNLDCPFKPFSIGWKSSIAAIEAWHRARVRVADDAQCENPRCNEGYVDKAFSSPDGSENWVDQVPCQLCNAEVADDRPAGEQDLCAMYGCTRDGIAYPNYRDLWANLLLLESTELDTTIAHAIKHGLLTRCREAVAELVSAAPPNDWAEKKAALVVSQWMATPERHYADLIAAVRDVILESLSGVAAPQKTMTDEADTWAIRQLFELPDNGDLFDQLREWLEHKEVGDVRVQNCVSNLLAEPVYEGLRKEGGIVVKFLMRLHLLAYEVGLERYGKDSPIVAEALAALGDPATNSEESLQAAQLRCSSSSGAGSRFR